MKKTAVAWLAAVAVMAVGYNASASISMNLGTVIGGGFVSGDSSSSPYLNATITDGTLSGNNGVYLTMTAPGLGFAGSALYEHVMGWQFNVSSISGLTFTETAKSGNLGFTSPTHSTGSFSDSPVADIFNIQFLFAEGGGGGPPDGQVGGTEFGFGDSDTFFIGGLSESSFVLTTGTPPNYYSAAHIDDASGGTWVAGSTASPVLTPVPEPTTMIAGALLLLPFGASTLRILRKKRTVSA